MGRRVVSPSLTEAADEISAPRNFRVEVVGQQILVAPPRHGQHLLTIRRISDAVSSSLPAGTMAVGNISLSLDASGERYVPDLVVLPRDVLCTEQWLFPAEAVSLVAEVAWPENRDVNRIAKCRGYATCAVPNYLLMDRTDSSVTLFSEPEDRVYRQQVQVPFGKPIVLPAPFDGTLGTSDFR